MFGGDAGAYGSLMAALGLGALVAALFTAARETATTGSLVVAAIGFGVLSTVLAGSPGLTFALVVTAGLGVTNFVFNTLVRTVMLLVSDAQMQGRVMALHGLVFLGSTPIGGLIIGWVCEQWGVRVGLLVGGVSVLLSAAGAIGMSRRASKVASGSPGRHVGADIAARPRNH